ncbi:MAG: trypsin-like peptidase domain-containing protein, partial [Candidatus Omnitrophica bacterium]|nr:trypsin-like peptidase domain-containing protein [Candidatus Omnitrophota bacterium]
MKIFVCCLICVLATFAYTSYEIHGLSNQIQKIENKLGGPDKLVCNESDTVEKVRRSVVRIVGGESEGSGFAIQKGGFILTNFHVIDGEPNPKVVFPDNTFETGQVIMADKDADLAVVRVKKDLPVLSLANLDGLGPAEEVLAIGYPLGGELSGESFIIRGAISRRSKDKTNGVQYLLTNMTLIPGISGGPMVNICGEVVGINTAGLGSGGMGMAISSDTIKEKCRLMSVSKDPLKDVNKTIFHPNKSALEAVKAFYNYLKARNLIKAFVELSQNFERGYSFDEWVRGYQTLLDTTIITIKLDPKIANRVHVKLSTKDLIDGEIVYKYFQGYWDVRQVDGQWVLWQPRIMEVKDPDNDWFKDDMDKELEEFAKSHDDFDKYKDKMA